MTVPDHARPQIVAIATLRRGKYGWIQTFELPEIFRLLELSCLVSIPTHLAEGAQVPVYVRFRVNTDKEDKPGTIAVDGSVRAPPLLACPHCGHVEKQAG